MNWMGLTINIYFDGPFYPDESLSPGKQATELRDSIFECMKKRSQQSDYEYIRYEFSDDAI